MTNHFNSDERAIIEREKNRHGEAYKKGNFGQANIIRTKLENIGVDGDFESTFEPEQSVRTNY